MPKFRNENIQRLRNCKSSADRIRFELIFNDGADMNFYPQKIFESLLSIPLNAKT